MRREEDDKTASLWSSGGCCKKMTLECSRLAGDPSAGRNSRQ